MKQSHNRVSDGLRDLLFPPKCVGCGELLEPFRSGPHRPGPDVFCPICRAAFDTAVQAHRLAAPEIGPSDCPGALRRVSLISYHPDDPDGVPQRVVYCLKHQNDSRVFDRIGTSLADAVRPCLRESGAGLSDVICAYPPRRAATARREGVDQAKQLSRRVAAHLGTACVALFARSDRTRTEQKDLGAADRAAHAQSVYRLKPGRADAVKGKTVILVDDLCTTGATLARLTELVTSAGAAGVVWATVGQTRGGR